MVYKESKVYDIKSISALAVSTSAGNKVTYLAKVNEEVKRISKAYFERLKSEGIKIVPNMKKYKEGNINENKPHSQAF
jgi:hypothetical protein